MQAQSNGSGPEYARVPVGVPAGEFAGLAITLLAIFGIGTRYCLRSDLNVIHRLLSLFFASNLAFCYWEICLFLRRDLIETRAGY